MVPGDPPEADLLDRIYMIYKMRKNINPVNLVNSVNSPEANQISLDRFHHVQGNSQKIKLVPFIFLLTGIRMYWL
jgi:uncharacterized protein YcbK (DUF882 family)